MSYSSKLIKEKYEISNCSIRNNMPRYGNLGIFYKSQIIEFYNDWQRDKQIVEMPYFEFKTLEGQSYNRDNLASKKTILMYFNPNCDHCKEEVEDIASNKKDFSEVQIVMVTPYIKAEVLKFDSIYQLSSEENITVLHDEKYEFYKIFNAKAFPTTYIYNANKKLKAKIRGKILHEDLIEKL